MARHRWQGGARDALFWQFLIAAIVMAPVAFWVEGPLPAAALTPPALALLAFIGPIASGLGFGLMIAAGGCCLPRRLRYLARPRR